MGAHPVPGLPAPQYLTLSNGMMPPPVAISDKTSTCLSSNTTLHCPSTNVRYRPKPASGRLRLTQTFKQNLARRVTKVVPGLAMGVDSVCWDSEETEIYPWRGPLQFARPCQTSSASVDVAFLGTGMQACRITQC